MNRILLVEDDKEISTMLKNFLTAENFEITTAPDGKRACEEFFAGNFSLVLLDLMIPELNGMEVMEKIRENSTVPIIILSANTQRKTPIPIKRSAWAWVRMIISQSHFLLPRCWRG